MREQASPFRRRGLVAARSENHVAPDGISLRVDRARRFGRLVIGMNTHPAEVVTEARLHVLPRRHVQRLAGTVQSLLHDLGRAGLRGTYGPALQHSQALVSTRRAFSGERRRLSAGTLAL
jgi:hypothetical protein